jgi:hypothetical protein
MKVARTGKAEKRTASGDGNEKHTSGPKGLMILLDLRTG